MCVCVCVCVHLSILKAVAARVSEVVAGELVATGVQVDGVGRSLLQELSPDLLSPPGHLQAAAPTARPQPLTTCTV